MTELLKKLCAINAPSGFEDAMREFIRTYAQPYAAEIHEDPAGNLMVLRRGKSDAKRIMLCAHMDEVGLIITQIDKSGLLKYAPIGRFPAATLAGKRVLVGDRAIPGIIGIKAIHMTSRKERGEVPSRDSIRIDLGARTREAAEKYTFRGDYAVFSSSIREFGTNRLTAKALDSRVCCATLLQLLPQTPAYDIWFVFSVQHQIGSGIQSAVHRLSPDLAVVLDGIAADDVPSGKNTCRLGAGLVVPTLSDAVRFDPKTLEQLQNLCQTHEIATQSIYSLPSAGELPRISASAAGVPTVSINIPIRYPYTPQSVIDLQDAAAAEKLLSAFLSE